jgi:polyisoprenoid-binding protein YceI
VTARAAVAAAAATLWLGLAATAARAEPVAHAVDPTHTQVLVELRIGLATVLGRFERVRGTLTLDRAAGRAAVELQVDAASWSSGHAALDTLVRGPALLDAERAPLIVFRADTIAVAEGDRVEAVEGRVERAGSAHPLRLAARRAGCYLNPLLQRPVCGGDFEASVPRAALGLAGGPDELAPTVRVRVQFEAIRS